MSSEARWLAWSGDNYPDESPGDVIAWEPDGTITLDDGITTWNPLRALAAARERQAQEKKARDELVLKLGVAVSYIPAAQFEKYTARLEEVLAIAREGEK